MLQPATLKFLEGLKLNNNKPWFEGHKDAYEAAKLDFEKLISEVLTGLASIEPGFKEQKAKDCVFRIYRDVRFAKDKTPYKPNFGAYMSRGGKKFNGAGYYLHLEPGGSFAAGGLWMPEANILKAVRQEIDYNFGEFEKIVRNKKFEKIFGVLQGEKLKSAPKDYAADNPAIEYLKMKSFTVMHKIDDEILTGKPLVKTCMDVYKTMQPMIDFLNRSLD